MKRRSKFLLSSVALLTADRPLVGGQAVMEGVLMRCGDSYGLAARVNGEIAAERKGWYTFLPPALSKRPFIRGVPVLVETMVNGVKSLNRAAELQGEADGGKPMQGWQLALTLLVSLALALGLFLLLPHVLTLLLTWLGVAGGVDGMSFHLWDGLFKMLILLGYVGAIGRIPEIRRVFQYHGAEHKTIRAFETGRPVDAALAALQSRLHPRCGTTFLLFVISISIILHAVLVPLCLLVWKPEGAIALQAWTLVLKFFLVLPTASLAYELIRFAARLKDGPVATLLRAPGMALQMLTTAEPDMQQLEVAVVALKEALGPDSEFDVRTVPYRTL